MPEPIEPQAVPAPAPAPTPGPAPEAAPSAEGASPRRKVNAIDLDKEPHTELDMDLLYRLYLDRRIQSQVDFYKSRIRENDRNADFTFTLGGLVMTISALFATISANGNQPGLALLATILPAFAALLASFRQLYGWERQSNLYSESLLGLEKVRLMAPDNDRVAVANLNSLVPELVRSSEAVFSGEVGQWGQVVLEADEAQAKSKGDLALRGLVSDLKLSDEQLAAIAAIMAAGKREGGVTVEEPEAPAPSRMSSGNAGALPAATITPPAPAAPPPPVIPTAPLPPDDTSAG